MTPAALERLITAMAGKRVVCVGDLILDRFIYGAADRVSREAPVVSLSQSRCETMLGACGNVARNIAALGGAPILIAPIGDDPESDEIAGLVENLAGEANLIRQSGRPTPIKTRYVAGGQQVLSVDRNPGQSISGDTEAAMLDGVQATLDAADIVVLSDYGRGGVTDRVAHGVITRAHAAGVRVVCDPRGRDFTRYNGAFLLKPNAQELALEAGTPVKSDDDARAALASVMARVSVDNLIVTRGGSGMALLQSGASEVTFHRSKPRDVYDVSGAGDTTAAALSLALAGGADLTEAIDLGNLAGGIVVTKVATATVRPNDLREDLHEEDFGGASVVDLTSASECVGRWRAEGKRIGLTNGCFDILHVGHLSTLTQARAACDRLVVGVNADASVKRLKGSDRPVNSETDRAQLIAALAPVDLVIIFGEDTASELVRALAPDVYVKGGDYDVEALPETPAVRAVGGEIILAPFQDGRSTTAILEKLSSD